MKLIKQAHAQITNPVIADQFGSAADATEAGAGFALLFAQLYRATVIIGGVTLLLYLAWGGLDWLTAGGDQSKADAARQKITRAVMGMAVLAGVFAIANFLGPVLGIDLLNPNFGALTTP